MAVTLPPVFVYLFIYSFIFPFIYLLFYLWLVSFIYKLITQETAVLVDKQTNELTDAVTAHPRPAGSSQPKSQHCKEEVNRKSHP